LRPLCFGLACFAVSSFYRQDAKSSAKFAKKIYCKNIQNIIPSLRPLCFGLVCFVVSFFYRQDAKISAKFARKI
ncbi:hypothetical protein KJ762_11460, partial [bacterium]|nr:hypothetical protein [bacterium]